MPRQKKNDVWENYFHSATGEPITCKHCDKVYKFGNVNKMTSHLLKCFKCPTVIKNKLKKISDTDTSTASATNILLHDVSVEEQDNSLTVKESLEDDDENEISEIQHSPLGQSTFNSVFIPGQNQRSTKLPELANSNAQLTSTLSTLHDVITDIKSTNVRVDEDDCDLYGRLLAKTLREFSDIDRLELRHEIDGLIIKKKRLMMKK